MKEAQHRPLVYLACPYSHQDRDVRVRRFESANRAAGALMGRGLIVFSPISHTHPVAEQCELPKGWEFWEQFDRAYLGCCHSLYVLCIEGWRESVGVNAEIKIADELGLEVLWTNERGDVCDDPIFAEHAE